MKTLTESDTCYAVGLVFRGGLEETCGFFSGVPGLSVAQQLDVFTRHGSRFKASRKQMTKQSRFPITRFDPVYYAAFSDRLSGQIAQGALWFLAVKANRSSPNEDT